MSDQFDKEGRSELNSGNLTLLNGGIAKKDEDKRKSVGDEDEEESALTNIDFNNQEVQEVLNSNLNLSEYCISSDADTEKMESDIAKEDEEIHPRLAQLINRQNSVESNETKMVHALEDADVATREDVKRQKIDATGTVKDIVDQQVPQETNENENEGDNEGDEEDEVEGDEDAMKQNDETEKKEELVSVMERSVPMVEKPTNENMEKKLEEVESKIEGDGAKLEKDEIKSEKEETKIEKEEALAEKEEALAEEEEAKIEKEELRIGNDGDENEEIEAEDEDEDDEDASGAVAQEGLSAMDLENQRMEALTDITDIEYKFADLRQKLYENKLVRLEIELQMCLEGSHPELHSYYQKIASIRDYKLRRAYQRQKYELKCIDKETRATRTFVHQDFYKKSNDLRNQLLADTTKQWYDINKERRDMDIVVPDVNYHVPVKIQGKTLSCITGYAGPAQQRLPGEPLSEDLECENIKFRYRTNPVDKLEVIVDRMRLNNQLSDLQGLKKFYNAFPGAPHLNSLRDSEINDDFHELQRQ